MTRTEFHSTYRGWDIYRVRGHNMINWRAGPYQADTLAGLKELIRSAE